MLHQPFCLLEFVPAVDWWCLPSTYSLGETSLSSDFSASHFLDVEGMPHKANIGSKTYHLWLKPLVLLSIWSVLITALRQCDSVWHSTNMFNPPFTQHFSNIYPTSTHHFTHHWPTIWPQGSMYFAVIFSQRRLVQQETTMFGLLDHLRRGGSGDSAGRFPNGRS